MQNASTNLRGKHLRHWGKHRRGRSVSGYDFRDLKVLVCDDSRHIRALVRMFLQGFGITDVIEAADADQAFEALEEHNPELLITDWNMPPTDGMELVERIRQGGEAPDPFVPIIMLTGYTELHRVKQARDTGVSAFLAKPVSAQALYKRLCAVVDDQRPFVRSNRYFGPDRRARRAAEYGGVERRGARAARSA
jgi:two-component system chemotaxis response regulator CheY